MKKEQNRGDPTWNENGCFQKVLSCDFDIKISSS